MNKLNVLLIASLTLLGAAQVSAAEVSHVDAELGNFTQAAPVSSLSRQAVTAEYLRARMAGEVEYRGEASFPTAGDKRISSTLTRAQVTAEYIRARKAGELLAADYLFDVSHQRAAM
jgi:hypothetical protein